MADEPEVKQPDDRALIMVAATLADAAATDERLAPLAAQALKMVIESTTAIVELLTYYKNGQQQPSGPMMPSQVRAQNQLSQTALSSALEQFKEALDKI